MSDFETFWRAYPRKVGKAMARAKWNAITTKGLTAKCKDRDGNVMDVELVATPEEIIEGALAYRWDSIDTEDRFVAHPTTWLNQGRWEDVEEDERAEKAGKMRQILEKVKKPSLRVVG